jgi:PAS domain S-box-containing protein
MQEERRTMSEAKILLVDDDSAKRLALGAILAPLGFAVVQADSGVNALRSVLVEEFAVILLDVRMPTMDGFETAAFIRQRQQSEMTPIIFITAFDGDEIGRKDHYSEGAVDFMRSPVDPEELRAKVSVFASLFCKAAALASDAEKVKTSADQLRLLTDAAPIGIFQTDQSGCYVYTNPRWSQLTQVSAENAIGQFWESFINPELLSGFATELFEGSRHFTISKVGEAPRVVLLTATAIPSVSDGMAGWVGTLADVTAEVGAEAAASHFRAVIESSRDAIISKDLGGLITSWNGGAERLYGYSKGEALGQPMSILTPEDHDAETSDVLRRVTRGETDVFESVRRRKDGTLVDVSLTTSPILGMGEKVVGASIIARDISDRRKAEQLKDEFLALVSHELRTPLSSIVAHTELLLDGDLVAGELRRQFLEVIARNSTRLERLVGDLLFVAQLESANLSLSMTDVDVAAVVAEAVEAVKPQADQSEIEVVLILPTERILVRGDPGRLGQAVDNLISNAMKYSPEGGSVTVSVRASATQCLIEIEDHGIGISASEKGALFDRFFRGSTAVDLHIQGVGLGLSIVKRIVEGHRGTVDVRSEQGSGTTFSIVLPIEVSSGSRYVRSSIIQRQEVL